MTSLSTTLREHTAPLHRRVERHAFVHDWLAGRLGAAGHVLALRSLQPLYAALEGALAQARADCTIAPLQALADPALLRAGALADDLLDWHGAAWADVPQAASVGRLAAHLATLPEQAPARLLAHAYVRYLGDLSGGRLLARAAERMRPDGTADGLRFYRFDDDPGTLAGRLREVLDAVPPACHDAVVDEAIAAFAWHGRLFDELQALRPDAEAQDAARMRP